MSRTHDATTTEVYALAALVRFPDLASPSLPPAFPTTIASHVAGAICSPGRLTKSLRPIYSDPALPSLLDDIAETTNAFQPPHGEAWARAIISRLARDSSHVALARTLTWAGHAITQNTRTVPQVLAEIRAVLRGDWGAA